MATLARFIQQPASWSTFADVLAEDQEGAMAKCPLGVMNDVGIIKGSGVSCWMVNPEDDAQIKRIVAAYQTTQKQISSINMKFIDTSILDENGISYKNTKVPNADEEIGNSLHYDIKIESLAHAFLLAKSMAEERSIKYGVLEVEKSIINSMKSGYFNVEKISKEFAQSLIKCSSFSIS